MAENRTNTGLGHLLPTAFILVRIGNDFAKLLLRKNYLISKNEFVRLIVGTAIVLGLVIYGLALSDQNMMVNNSFPFLTLTSLWIMAVFYLCLCFYVIRKAVKLLQLSGSENTTNSEIGETLYLIPFSESSRRKGEPFYLITLGILFAFVNLWGTIPLLFAGISMWIMQLLQFFMPQFFPSQIHSHNKDSNEFSDVN